MTERTIKKVGDLIQERAHPEYGRALVIEVGDRRKRNPYRILAPRTGTHWLDKNYIECKCEAINETR
jgi:hypothetical protein